jgi:hypothetical protein
LSFWIAISAWLLAGIAIGHDVDAFDGTVGGEGRTEFVLGGADSFSALEPSFVDLGCLCVRERGAGQTALAQMCL